MNIRTLALSAVCATVLAGPAMAFDMGKLNSILETGQSGAWDQRGEGANYVLDNDSNPASIRYYYIEPNAGHEGTRSVSVDLDFRDEAASTRGGLIFGFDKTDKSYYLFVLSPTGELTLFKREPGGGKILFKGKAKGITDGFNTFTLVEANGGVRLEINGQSSLFTESKAMRTGALGIVAWGQGEFAFRNFSLEFVGN